MNAAKAWPLAIVGVLALTVVANAVLLWAASDRSAGATEPDYYRKGVAWDSTLALEERSDALGWTVEAGIAAPASGGAEVRVRLRTADGAPIEGARVEVEAVHNLEADHHLSGALVERAPGEYAARFALRHAGRWELRVRAERGADRFARTLHAEAPRSEAP